MTELARRLRADRQAATGSPCRSAGEAGRRLAADGPTAAEAPDPGRLLLEFGVRPPPELLAEFAAGVGASWRACPDHVAAEQLWDMFERQYLIRESASVLLVRCTQRADRCRTDPWIALFNIRQSVGMGQESPALAVSGFLTAMGLDVTVLSRHSQTLETSGLTIAYVKCLAGFPAWGVGIGGDLSAASLKAVLSAVNRAGQQAAGDSG
jgi:2-isopropylmalate synthase